ncbi:MAG: hypothetical protein GTO71_14225 [Woeseiaceae bacterium]|nr:hypothetical protein [Woeseiaceae bacterium]NIP22207.1 hypothetical protein [Woeseiaceae bacterium]
MSSSAFGSWHLPAEFGDSRAEISVRGIQLANDDAKSLAQAIEQVRRKTKGRIVSAETRVSGGREVHYIKVLTKDGKVKTHKVAGRKTSSG